jgi:pilus assembly protein CpaC
MQMNVMKACGLGLIGLVGTLSAGFLTRSEPAAAASHGLESTHHSVLRVSSQEAFPIHRLVKLGRGKSMMIELPREVRDVVVSDPKVLDAVVQSASRVFLVGKAFTGQTNVFMFDANGERMMTLEITVDSDMGALEALYKRLMPSSRIKVETLHGSIILTGSVATASDASRAQQIAARFAVMPAEATDGGQPMPHKVINMLAVESKEQVMLRVTVAEVNRSLLKQMGVNLGAAIASGNFGFDILTENSLPLTAALGLGSLPVSGFATAGADAGRLFSYNRSTATGATSTAPYGNSGVTTFWGSGNNTANGAVRMLERNGLLRTLAEPNLTAISGETARFLAGGEFPIPVADGLGAISVQFKKFGVGLAFTPMVAAEDRITLKIESEVSELSNQGSVSVGGIAIPALKTRQANTTVELPSGGALAIAGLLSDDTRQNIDGVPGLKDVPVLGTLFRSRDYVKQETELVVIVQPLVVKTATRHQLAHPADGLAPASDIKANLLGHFNRIYGKGPEHQPAGRYEGDYGFIIE